MIADGSEGNGQETGHSGADSAAQGEYVEKEKEARGHGDTSVGSRTGGPCRSTLHLLTLGYLSR